MKNNLNSSIAENVSDRILHNIAPIVGDTVRYEWQKQTISNEAILKLKISEIDALLYQNIKGGLREHCY
jgi:hypothetical protein